MQFAKKGNNPVLTVGYLWRGLKWLPRPELRPFVLLPLLVNIVLYGIALALGYFYLSDLIEQFIPDWLSWLRWVLWPLFFISFFIVGFFTFTMLANLIAAPFYGHLSAKTLSLLSGGAESIEEPPLTKVMLSELGKVGYFLSRALPLLIVSVIPGLNVAAPFLWALYGSWCSALEYLGYPLENEGVLFAEQKQLVKSVRIGALSFGGVTMFGLTLPVINIIIAPAAVIGATIYFYEAQDDRSPGLSG